MAIDAQLLRTFRDAVRHQLNIALDDEDIVAYDRFHGLLVEANARVNLTRIIEPADFLLKHVMDSLAVVRVVSEFGNRRPLSVLDLGTGGGVPGIPLAIAFPRHHYWLVDSTAKKIREVNGMCNTLALSPHCTVLHARARELAGKAHGLQWRFDAILARAAGSVKHVAGECGKLPAKFGRVIVYASADQARCDGVKEWKVVETDPFTLSLNGMTIHRKFFILRRRIYGTAAFPDWTN